MHSDARAAANDPLGPHLVEARRLMRAGLAVLLLGLLPVGAWTALAPLTSAVVANGYVKVDLERRPVQHAEGGLVREVLVRDGQHVRQGEPMLVLGDVAVQADVNRLDYRVKAERLSAARLEAEQAAAPVLRVPAELLAAAQADPRLAEQLANERALFEARRRALQQQLGLLHLQREKVAQEMVALRAQIERAGESLRYQRTELETNRRLAADGFISATRLAQLEGTVADYGVKLEERRSELARADQRMVDADLRMRTLEGEYRQQASEQLKSGAARLSEIEQELRAARDAAARQVIKAPAAGEVIDLKVTSPGTVIAPRETIASIVPADPRLLTEARIRTEDIERVRPGQAAQIRYTAFRYRTTRLVHGKVIYVSADRLQERADAAPYYRVLVEPDAASLAAAGGIELVAGMPAEIYIEGEHRTPLEYLLQPVTQVLRRAARER